MVIFWRLVSFGAARLPRRVEVEVENGTPTYETRRLVPISALGGETKPVGSGRRVIPAKRLNDVTESNGGRS
jgi:hypothetical protein